MRNAVRAHTEELVRSMGGIDVSRVAGREAAPGGQHLDDTMEEF